MDVVIVQRELALRMYRKRITFVQGMYANDIIVKGLPAPDIPFGTVQTTAVTFVDARSNLFSVPSSLMALGGVGHVTKVHIVHDCAATKETYSVDNAFRMLHDKASEMNARVNDMGDPELVYAFLWIHMVVTSLLKNGPTVEEFPTMRQAAENVARAVRLCFTVDSATRAHALHAMYSFDSFTVSESAPLPFFDAPADDPSAAGQVIVLPLTHETTTPQNASLRRLTHTNGAVADALSVQHEVHNATTGTTRVGVDYANLAGANGATVFEFVQGNENGNGLGAISGSTDDDDSSDRDFEPVAGGDDVAYDASDVSDASDASDSTTSGVSDVSSFLHWLYRQGTEYADTDAISVKDTDV
jgi:hypothetical protein